MVNTITLTLPVRSVASLVVLSRADLAHVSGGATGDVSAEKTRHDTAQNAIGDVR
jgi:hypothetical protein